MMNIAKTGMVVSLILGYSLNGVAADFPTKPIRMIVPFAAGGPLDGVARTVGEKIQARLGQPVVTENRPGAAGIVGANATLAAEPDGHTLFIGGTNYTTVFFKSLPFDLLKDFASVAYLSQFPLVIETNSSVPAKTISEFVAYAKANPGKLNYGSTGSNVMMAMELLKNLTGMQMTHISYKSAGDSTRALLANDIQAIFSVIPTHRAQAAEGKVIRLAVTTAERTSLVPGVQTMVEQGFKQFVMSGSAGVWVRAATPKSAIAILNKEINAAIESPEIRDRVQNIMGGQPVVGPPEAYWQYAQQEGKFWAQAAAAANYKPE